MAGLADVDAWGGTGTGQLDCANVLCGANGRGLASMGGVGLQVGWCLCLWPRCGAVDLGVRHERGHELGLVRASVVGRKVQAGEIASLGLDLRAASWGFWGFVLAGLGRGWGCKAGAKALTLYDCGFCTMAALGLWLPASASGR